MIRITQLKLPINHGEQAILKKAARLLKIREEQIEDLEIIRKSLDARHKNDLLFSYTIDVMLSKNTRINQKIYNNNIMLINKADYEFPTCEPKKLDKAPIIVGCGPAGLFCGYMLAKAGYEPLILERGEAVENRQKTVEEFWNNGKLNPESNVQFGEGGAGTFSDGKLNSLVKDKLGRGRKVLEIFVEMGAPKEILYEQKPHLGTDILVRIVKNLRQTIESYGGKIRFQAKVTDIITTNNHITGVIVNEKEEIPADTVVFALGHSARDTFFQLYERKLHMESKSFAVGVRIEHPQSMINQSQYGSKSNDILGAAAYKLTHQTEDGRGIYTFCMCPGGYVVNASSEENMLAVNGMSYSKRDSENANSALIVTVTPEDYSSYADENVPKELAGISFQRTLEKKAYALGQGKIPVQRFEDFKENIPTKALGAITPCIKGEYCLSNVREIFPGDIGNVIEEGILAFDRKISGYASRDVLLSGVESRSSSPIRMVRNEDGEASIGGIYPCGEGAGYAGGITSAAIDGIKVAEYIAKKNLNL